MKNFDLDIHETIPCESFAMDIPNARQQGRSGNPRNAAFDAPTRHPALNMFARGGASGNSTRAIPSAECDDSIHASVSANTGIPADKCAEVLVAYMDQFFMCAAGSRSARAMHDFLSAFPDLRHASLERDGFCVAG